jgi:hypothetical protein
MRIETCESHIPSFLFSTSTHPPSFLIIVDVDRFVVDHSITSYQLISLWVNRRGWVLCFTRIDIKGAMLPRNILAGWLAGATRPSSS